MTAFAPSRISPFTRIATIPVLCCVLSGAGCSRGREAENYPILGKAPVYAARLETAVHHGLGEWFRAGYRSRTVIHVSTESGLAFVPEVRIAEWRDELSRGDEGVGSPENYLYVAARMGIVGKVYWVVPEAFWKEAGAGERAKGLLRSGDTIFPADEVGALKMIHGCLEGHLNAVPVSICPPYALPHIRDPVILDIDAGFFPRYAEEEGVSPLRATKVFLDKLALRGYQVMSVHIGEIPGARLPGPVHRHLGEEIHEMIVNPEVLKAEKPPEIWAVRDGAANMLAGGEDRLVLDVLEGAEADRYREDAALTSMRAVAAAMLGGWDRALADARSACGAAPAYCDLFIEIGDRVSEGGDPAVAEEFYREALRARPGWAEAEDRLGKLFVSRGRFDEAEEHYRAALAAGETIEGRLRMGDAALLLGRKDDALREYGRALDLSGGRIGVRATDRNRESLDRAAGLFEEAGLPQRGIEARTMRARLGAALPGEVP